MDDGQTDGELRVFVYGTLKPGGKYYEQYCDGVESAIASQVPGQIFDFPELGFPGMVGSKEDDGDWVQGYLLRFVGGPERCAQTLRRLDALEEYVEGRSPDENDYERYWRPVYRVNGSTEKKVVLDWAWLYEMKLSRVQAWGGVRVESGNWEKL